MCKPEHEIFRKPITITLNPLIEPEGRNPIESSQISVQNHSLTTDHHNQSRYVRTGICYCLPHIQPFLG